MTTEQDTIIKSWHNRLKLVPGAQYKNIPEPMTHLQNVSVRWQQPEIGFVDGILKIDYLPDPEFGYIDTVSFYNFILIFTDSSQIGQISAHSLLKIIYDGISNLIGTKTPMSISLEYSDPFDNTIILALGSNDMPQTTDIEIDDDN